MTDTCLCNHLGSFKIDSRDNLLKASLKSSAATNLFFICIEILLSNVELFHIILFYFLMCYFHLYMCFCMAGPDTFYLVRENRYLCKLVKTRKMRHYNYFIVNKLLSSDATALLYYCDLQNWSKRRNNTES